MPKHKFEAIGTQWEIETPTALPDLVTRELAHRVETFDRTYSRFRDDSLVAQLRRPGKYTFPKDATALIELYRQLYDATDGAVSPLVGAPLEQAGYDQEYRLAPQADIRPAPQWDDAMVWQGADVEVKQPIVLDVGAAGKGYLVDLLGKLLMSHNIHEYVIDASGDVQHRGATIERVGLENPYNALSVVGVAELHNASLCASASNRRSWGDWHHVVDPRTAKPVREVVATWVIASSTMVADGLATALFFVPPPALADWEFQAVRLMNDGRLEYTPNFVGELFI